MKLSYTLNDMDAFAICESRRNSFYDLIRSYAGIPVGAHFSTAQALEFARTELIVYTDEEDTTQKFWSIRRERFDLRIVYHACEVHQKRIRLGEVLAKLTYSEKSTEGSFAAVRLAHKQLRDLLKQVEW